MPIIIALIVLAVIFGVIGLIVEALWWLLVIGGILLIIGIFRAVMAGRTGSGGTTGRR